MRDVLIKIADGNGCGKWFILDNDVSRVEAQGYANELDECDGYIIDNYIAPFYIEECATISSVINTVEYFDKLTDCEVAYMCGLIDCGAEYNAAYDQTRRKRLK